MTIPGEFYLNFGLLGVLIGPFLFGGILALFWQSTSFWHRPQDALGSAFGFYLIWVGVLGGADLQILVTLVAVYLLFAAASLFLQGSQAHPRTVVRARKPLPTASGDAA